MNLLQKSSKSISLFIRCALPYFSRQYKLQMKRIEQLLAMLETEPNDTFLLYALALEYQNKGEVVLAEKYFDMLLINYPQYLATYYPAAAFYAEKQEVQKAKKIYEKGIEVALFQNNIKALAELRSAYNNFLILEDE